MDGDIVKPIIWMGSSLRDLKTFPQEVQKEVGYALWLAQAGGKYQHAKPLKGLRGVMEIASDFKTDTYRAVYAIKLGEALYVLHTFQKKSSRGIATPRQDMDMIKKRLQEARRLAQG